MSAEIPGQIITFYSYKGGTGRTMALVNVACLLAQRQIEGSKGVLMIDWDLEAPGLHWFLRDKFEHRFDDPGRGLDERPGLIDLFWELAEATHNFNGANKRQTEAAARALLYKVEPERFILETDIPYLHLLKAGRLDSRYPARVTTFQWEALYNRSPWLIRLLAERLAERYRYVLIDSRTGVTDTSGICTMLMPERLVLVFTPNRQSLTGAIELIQQAIDYRKQSDDLRPLVVFPLPSRIDTTKESFHKDWRYGNSEQGIVGYQSQFERLFEQVYDLPRCNLEAYFSEVQIQHVSDYAYGEKIAVLAGPSTGRLDLKRSYESFTERLVKLATPWEGLETAAFDVFLAYHSQDKSQVEAIAQALKKRGLRPWLTEEQIRPGQSWQDALERAISQVKSAAVFIGPKGLGRWQNLELHSLVSRPIEVSLPVIPVLLPGVDDLPEDLSILKQFTQVRFSKINDPEALDALEWGITGKRPRRTSKVIDA
ncbi:MAG: TIR domain-containing protein [Chloroflexota bacterium]